MALTMAITVSVLMGGGGITALILKVFPGQLEKVF